jgi:hypothetical protein
MSAAQVPIFSEPGGLHGAVRVRHREYLGDLLTSVEVDAIPQTRLRINPSNDVMFPWLSIMATNFEQWIPLGIVFEYVSTCGNAFSAGAANLGDINVATQYNVLAPGLNNKKQVLNHFFSTSAATAQNLMHAIECAPGDTPCLPRYIKFGGGVVGDNRLDDLGIVNILTTGSQSVYTAGQSWVTYDIILLKPRINPDPAKLTIPIFEATRIEEMARRRGKPLTREQIILLLETETKESEEESEEQHILTQLYGSDQDQSNIQQEVWVATPRKPTPPCSLPLQRR